MRPWFAPLVALVLLALASSPALAAFAHGLECTALGASTVTSPPDESSLHVSNIGSSGNDGVSMSLYDLDGHRCVCSSSWSSSTDVGAQVMFDWEQVSGPTTFHHTCAMTRTSSGITLGGSLFVFGGSSTESKLYLYEGDQLVSTNVLYESTGLEITNLPALSSIPIVDLERDGRQDLVVCSVSFPSLVTISGSPLLFDRAVMVSGFSTDGKIRICHARVTNPPGGSLSSLDISSQSLMRQGHAMSSLGQMHFSEPVAFSHSQGLNIGSSGQDGVSITESPLSVVRSSSSGSGGGGGGGAGGVTWSSSRPSMMSFSSGSLVLTPGTDDGASLRCDVTGSSSCSPTGVVASLTALVRSTDLLLSSSFSSMCADAESVLVSLHGTVVSRQAVALDGSVTVTPPPGGPLGMAINEKGLPGEKGTKKTNPKVTEDIFGNPVHVVTSGDELAMRITFANPRAFTVGGTTSIGDRVTFVGRQLSVPSTVLLTGTQYHFTRSSTGTSAMSTVDVQDVTSAGGDQVSALSPSSSLSLSSATVQVPVMIERLDPTPARGYSITAQLSSNVVIGSIVEYDYLSRVGNTQMLVTDLGNNRYVVDCTILGDPCGASGSGVLFTLPISAAPGATDGTGTVTIEEVALRDCDNEPLPCDAGGTGFVTLDFTAPSAPTGVTATQVTTGNPAGSTTGIAISFTLADPTHDGVEIYRSSYGNYPEYDDAPGSGVVPTLPPSYPPGAGWTRLSLCYSTNCGATWTDQPLSRDAYYYVCYSIDNSGNWTQQSSMTTGTLNYHLGDFSDGVASCTGDNHVDAADISALGSSYGALLSPGSSLACLDVGPTSNHRVSGRPLTDNKLNFEDLILSAINFSRVSVPGFRAQPVAAATNSVRLAASATPPVGETFEATLHMSGAGDIQGLSVQLDFDPAVVELLSVSPGDLIGRQDRSGVVLAGGGGRVDGALLGEGGGIAGEGELARVAFRVRAAGDARLAVAGADARDVQNREVPVALLSSPGGTPARTAIRYAYPNPFDRETRVEFMLPRRAPVTIGVFDVAGRHVRTLMEGVQDAGLQSASWDGRDERGVQLGAGVYMIRCEAPGVRETRAVRLVR